MASQRPTVSVVVPCYCYGRYLEQCVGSILKQEGVDVRVLIVDDASLDDSFAVAEKLAAGDSRVEARRHKVNQGHIATYNEGLLEWADGEYSVLISADDVLVDGSLARAVAVMERYPNVGLVYGHAINWVDDRPLPRPRQVPTAIRVWKGLDWIRTVCRLGHNIITSPEVVVRTKLQREVGGYRPELIHSGDLEMWLRFAARCDIAFIEGADQAYYRIHASNMTVARSPTVDLVQRAAAFQSFFADCEPLLPDAQELRQSAQRQIAKEALWRACRAYERRRMAETPIVELKQLAYDTYPDSRRLPEYWGLRWRERVGPGITPYLQVFMLSAVHRRVRKILWWRRWRRKGY
jgi:glycosyltransferase involved in cell wall biosynthesis